MAELKDFLESFKKILEKGVGEKDLILNVLNKTLNVSLEKDDIKIKNETLFVKSNPYLKSEISLHKENILREIKKEGIEVSIKDIK